MYSYDGPGFKTGPAPGITSWNKEGRIRFVGKMTRMSNPGPSWPSCLFFPQCFDCIRELNFLFTYKLVVCRKLYLESLKFVIWVRAEDQAVPIFVK